MDSINFQKLHTKKTTKPQKHRRHLRNIANVLRYVEACVVLVLISRLSIQLPMAVKNTSEYFRNFMGSPRLVFLVGNVIIITLFAQSGHFSSNHASTKTAPEPDLYHEFLHNSVITRRLQNDENNRREKLSVRTENKRIGNKGLEVTMKVENKGYRRCQSEIVTRVQSEKGRRVLDRCGTERVGRTSYPEDGMSNDEFRRKIEAFIARQQKLRTEEELLCV
ncbi:hypothetical protein RJT34_08237 [Clitoria ternatea]|uniref:DUF4408 domain-containing protein n=1 Tax=Clitoria ternatea TaxID=43366 RepID=A0AAN9PSN7_CLITE